MTASNITNSLPKLRLSGVHHTARPTWKLEETVRFYRDQMGLPLVHAISARGWGPDDHADFLHFFFDSGNGSTIAFFYYIGTERPDWLQVRDHYQDRATHTAWLVKDAEELAQWRRRLEDAGVPVRYQIRHEIIESIYFTDPNGYSIEITYQVRPFSDADISDANLTIDSAIELEKQKKAGGTFKDIDSVWQEKGRALGGAEPRARASIYVLDVPEFAPLVEVATRTEGYTVTPINNFYVRIDGNPKLVFRRKELGFKPAVWYGALTGGMAGKIEQFDMDALVIAPEEAQ